MLLTFFGCSNNSISTTEAPVKISLSDIIPAQRNLSNQPAQDKLWRMKSDIWNHKLVEMAGTCGYVSDRSLHDFSKIEIYLYQGSDYVSVLFDKKWYDKISQLPEKAYITIIGTVDYDYGYNTVIIQGSSFTFVQIT